VAKVDGSLKSLLQGVSQQSPRDRLSGQCSLQENMSSDPVDGLTRRPPTDLVGELMLSAVDVRGWYKFETSDGLNYLLAVMNNQIRVWDMNGVEKTVTIGGAAADYLVEDGKFLFFGDKKENYVLIANNAVVPAMAITKREFGNAGIGAAAPSGIVDVRGGAYGRTYEIKMDNTIIARVKTADGSQPVHAERVDTSNIARLLVNSMTSTTDGPAGTVVTANGSEYTATRELSGANWQVTRENDIIYIRNTGASASQFTLTCTDGYGGANLKVMTNQVSDKVDLPRIAPHRYLIRVATETDPEEDLFLQFIAEGYTENNGIIGGLFGRAGSWQETVSSTTPYNLLNSTMPHKLKYDPVAKSFSFVVGTWDNRKTGTEISNPDPSFVGNPINGISSFQSRLVLIAGNTVCMSRTNREFNFFKGSAMALVDSDPIDIGSSADEASTFTSIIPFNKDLVVFSKTAQFVVFGRQGVTPANAALVNTTSYENEPAARPVPSGRNIFFAFNYGRFTGIREFYTEGGTEINDSRPVTQHVKKYLLGKVVHMEASTNYDTLIVQTDVDSRSLYAYQFIWADNEKIQSAWSTWKFTYPVSYFFFEEELIYYIVKTSTDKYIMLRQSLDVLDSEGVTFPCYLDARFDVFGTTLGVIVPTVELASEDLRFMQSVGCPNPGLPVPVDSIDPITGDVMFKEDMLGGQVVGGIYTESRYIPTPPIVKDQDDVPVSTGTLRIAQYIASVRDTADIQYRVETKYGTYDWQDFSGRIVGSFDNVIGQAVQYTGEIVMPFRHKPEEADIVIKTNGFYPMILEDIDWVGQYNKRGKRVSTGSK
jgi:hypothetical protein